MVQSGAPRIILPSASPEFTDTIEETGKYVNIRSEELKQNDATNVALSKLNPVDTMDFILKGDDESPLHKDIDASPHTPKAKQAILTQSDKEYKSIIFIQAMVRVSLTISNP